MARPYQDDRYVFRHGRFALGVFVLVPLLEFAVVLELAILSIGWIISNIFGAIPVLAGPLLGALAAAVVPGVNRGESETL
ncbi:hypothetical protein ABOD65_14700 [Mycobacterium tuberculosis]|uniref:hypothetical protein n=1 Tax=Mycobacterium tuberculosis TaxID=1773 RepID=UPI0032DFF83F